MLLEFLLKWNISADEILHGKLRIGTHLNKDWYSFKVPSSFLWFLFFFLDEAEGF